VNFSVHRRREAAEIDGHPLPASASLKTNQRHITRLKMLVH